MLEREGGRVGALGHPGALQESSEQADATHTWRVKQQQQHLATPLIRVALQHLASNSASAATAFLLLIETAVLPPCRPPCIALRRTVLRTLRANMGQAMAPSFTTSITSDCRSPALSARDSPERSGKGQGSGGPQQVGRSRQGMWV